jgi:hypothetical protein
MLLHHITGGGGVSFAARQQASSPCAVNPLSSWASSLAKTKRAVEERELTAPSPRINSDLHEILTAVCHFPHLDPNLQVVSSLHTVRWGCGGGGWCSGVCVCKYTPSHSSFTALQGGSTSGGSGTSNAAWPAIEVPNDSGETALSVAAANGQIGCVQLLLQSGCTESGSATGSGSHSSYHTSARPLYQVSAVLKT